MALFPIISCEHAGKLIPPPYIRLFRDEAELLNTHRGMDFGALELGQELAAALHAPFYYTEISRLLIEANRSLHHPSLFSKITRKLNKDRKESIIRKYYMPHRQKVEEAIADAVRQDKQVIHLSIHSFTPELDGEVRNADIGLLYDPKRRMEKAFCKRLENDIRKLDDKLNVRFNYPYLGTADGFTTYLRKQFDAKSYAGVEIELNQKYPLSGTQEWQALKRNLIAAMRQSVKEFSISI